MYPECVINLRDSVIQMDTLVFSSHKDHIPLCVAVSVREISTMVHWLSRLNEFTLVCKWRENVMVSYSSRLLSLSKTSCITLTGNVWLAAAKLISWSAMEALVYLVCKPPTAYGELRSWHTSHLFPKMCSDTFSKREELWLDSTLIKTLSAISSIEKCTSVYPATPIPNNFIRLGGLGNKPRPYAGPSDINDFIWTSVENQPEGAARLPAELSTTAAKRTRQEQYIDTIGSWEAGWTSIS